MSNLRDAAQATPTYRIIKDSTHEERSLKEGQYSCTCFECGRSFTAHKRSVCCEVCRVEPPKLAADKPAEWVGLTDDEINDCFEEVMFSPTNSPASRELIGKAIEAALRAKNAKPAEQTAQPVAWGMLSRGVIVDAICPAEHDKEEGDYTIPLYDHPAPIGNLSDEEIFAVENAVPDEVIGDRAWTLHFARAILEAARNKR